MPLRRAENRLTILGRDVADNTRRVGEAVRTRENELRTSLASSFDRIAGPNGKITKFKSQLSIALGHVTMPLRRAQNRLTTLGRDVADNTRRVGEAVRTRENELRTSLASSFDRIAGPNGKITKFKSQLSIALGHVTMPLRRAQNRLTTLGRDVV